VVLAALTMASTSRRVRSPRRARSVAGLMAWGWRGGTSDSRASRSRRASSRSRSSSSLSLALQRQEGQLADEAQVGDQRGGEGGVEAQREQLLALLQIGLVPVQHGAARGRATPPAPSGPPGRATASRCRGVGQRERALGLRAAPAPAAGRCRRGRCRRPRPWSRSSASCASDSGTRDSGRWSRRAGCRPRTPCSIPRPANCRGRAA
jgi:hypothetical protein